MSFIALVGTETASGNGANPVCNDKNVVGLRIRRNSQTSRTPLEGPAVLTTRFYAPGFRLGLAPFLPIDHHCQREAVESGISLKTTLTPGIGGKRQAIEVL
jgi:hypothetical protein